MAEGDKRGQWWLRHPCLNCLEILVGTTYWMLNNCLALWQIPWLSSMESNCNESKCKALTLSVPLPGYWWALTASEAYPAAASAPLSPHSSVPCHSFPAGNPPQKFLPSDIKRKWSQSVAPHSISHGSVPTWRASICPILYMPYVCILDNIYRNLWQFVLSHQNLQNTGKYSKGSNYCVHNFWDIFEMFLIVSISQYLV